MFMKKLLAGALTAALVVTMIPGDITQVSAEDNSQTPKEITIDKNDEISINPINGFNEDGTPRYGGDPSVLVDGNTVYLYVGRDNSTSEGYYMPDWACYSTTDLKEWKYESVIMSADKESVKWANTGTDAWAGQVAKYKDKYYFYYCTWDKTSGGEQSIGVATSNSPIGPFTDIGEPLVKGTTTTKPTPVDNWSNFNDIDPTVWIETDSEGVEHRYLCWGNNKLFICELNEDMISVKDINGDGETTFGVQKSSKLDVDADIVEMLPPKSFTEAPWLYRRKDADDNYYGNYYLFYAYGWREQMAYATIPADTSLMTGKWTYGTDGKNGLLMEPAATSNTNHMAVFDFKGKTYFIYHNGSLPGGSGFRRSACIAEVHFNEDGSIQAIPETTVGIHGTTAKIYTSAGTLLTHDAFKNSTADDIYPYKNIAVTGKTDAESMDAKWVISAGKADKKKESYVSIQSENKPGLYLTVNDNKGVTLSQDSSYSVTKDKTGKNIIKTDEATAKKQTFKTVEGLADSKGVSFESVSQPGEYLTVIGNNSLCVTNGSWKAASTFYLDEAPTVTPDEGTPSSINSLTSLAFTGYKTTSNATDKSFSTTVPYETATVGAVITLADDKGYYTVDGVVGISGGSASVVTASKTTKASLKIFAEDGTEKEAYTIIIEKNPPTIAPVNMTSSVIYSYGFDGATGNAFAVGQAFKPSAVSNPSYKYTDDGINGKAIVLDGSYGLDLGDASKLGANYSISFWMKPNELHGANDPTFCAGTFNPQHWLSLTFGRAIWSYKNGFVDDAGTVTYTANEWQHVVCTVEGKSAKLYINGELAASGSIAEGIMTNTDARLYFGVTAWDALYKGAVDEVVLLNRAITDNEVKAIAYNLANIGNNLNTTSASNNNNNDGNKTPATQPSLSLSKTSVTLYTGKASKSATIKPTVTGASQTVTWKSSKPKVATVKNGKITAVGKGTATITATANGISKTVKVTVKDPTLTIKKGGKKFTKSKLTVNKKKKAELTVTVSPKNSGISIAKLTAKQKKIASVTLKSGKITIKGKKKGSFTLQIKSGKATKKIKITVK